ncbi:hypothetical protein NM688_g621 [Phlebia brevispora]|uniref:Uncharacterized protein n=1 Tax=Phlebia brevispora TaxID=194682 RepID=A0ACC1TE30_9APHY|nr:hypothetical protein NM688_g621 [Phlebia brevispora]
MASPTRRPSNWEALKALESVSPPSPSPSLGSAILSNLCSVGEIPIILDAGLLETDVSSSSIATLTPSRPIIQASSSSATLGTIGTFGPRRPVSESSTISSLSQSLANSLDVSSMSLGYGVPTNQSVQFLSPHHDTGYYDRRISDVSGFTLSAYMSPSGQQIQGSNIENSPVASRSRPEGVWWNNQSSTQLLPISGQHESFRSSSSLSTLLFAPASGLAAPFAGSASDLSTGIQMSVTTVMPGTRIHLGDQSDETSVAPLEQFPSSPRIHACTPTTRPSTSSSSSPSRIAMHGGNERPRLRTKSTSTTNSNGSDRSAQSGKSLPTHRPSSSNRILSPRKYPNALPGTTGIPKILSWLENITIELWIDQEGFRLVRPTFRLSYFNGTLSNEPTASSTEAFTCGNAEFLPIDKQAFTFHYAPLDPPPTLRKITMADDESRDYISRQASLAIKSNGIYSVSGTESFDPGLPSPRGLGPQGHQPSGTNGPPKLTWRFEYQVDDIRPGSAPKGRQAEKTLTPLSFCCSPGLFHPNHGKKIRIIQVVKKGLTPKLISAKVDDAPKLAPAGAVPVDVSPEKYDVAKAQRHEVRVLSPLHALHRGVHSPSTDLPSAGDTEHDKASSEGVHTGPPENYSATSVVVVPVLHKTIDPESIITSSSPHPNDAVRQLPRHILPPEEINHLLDEDTAPPNRAEPEQARSLPPPWRQAA